MRLLDDILDIFVSTGRRLCVEELYLLLKKSYSGIGYATVHRTLKLPASDGLAE